MMLSISHKRLECVGCMLCAEVSPNYWKMDDEGLAQLHRVVRAHKHFEYGEGFEEDRRMLKEAEDGCPVGIIRIDT